MKSSYRFYKGCYRLSRAVIGIFYRFEIVGAENIPDGAAMICANHTSNIDPFFIAFAFGIKRHMHMIAKAELFRIPVISAILRKLGMISVDRETTDVATIRATLSYLKKGEKVAIFPEGTRVTEKHSATPKIGAIKLAEHAGAAIIPVHVPAKKPLFRKMRIVIGTPYIIEKSVNKRIYDDYEQLTKALMEKIQSLSTKY